MHYQQQGSLLGWSGRLKHVPSLQHTDEDHHHALLKPVASSGPALFRQGEHQTMVFYTVGMGTPQGSGFRS